MRLRHRGFPAFWSILVLAVIACGPSVPGESSEAPSTAATGEGVPVF